MTSEFFYFNLPIGDWSNDGHGKCEWILCKAEQPVTVAREAFFRAKEDMGFGLDEVCGDYQESWIAPEYREELAPFHNLSAAAQEEGDFTAFDFGMLVIDVLNHYAPELKMRPMPRDIAMLSFYGYDKQGRHIGHIGYGLMGD